MGKKHAEIINIYVKTAAETLAALRSIT